MHPKDRKKNKDWIVYILRFSDESLYTGITNNIENRLFAHSLGTGAKYTRSRRPVKLMATSAKMKRTDAMRLELKIKKLPKENKLSALNEISPVIRKSESIICRECSDGCNLIIQRENTSYAIIAGNKCAAGISFIAHLLRKNKKVHFQADKKTCASRDETSLTFDKNIRGRRFDVTKY